MSEYLCKDCGNKDESKVVRKDWKFGISVEKCNVCGSITLSMDGVEKKLSCSACASEQAPEILEEDDCLVTSCKSCGVIEVYQVENDRLLAPYKPVCPTCDYLPTKHTEMATMFNGKVTAEICSACGNFVISSAKGNYHIENDEMMTKLIEDIAKTGDLKSFKKFENLFEKFIKKSPKRISEYSNSIKTCINEGVKFKTSKENKSKK